MIRGLSHGKFTGVVLTKSIAESVLTARLLSALREKRVDIDETVKAMRKGKDKTKQAIPDKTSEATKFIQPLVDAVVHNLQPFLVTMDQTATSSGDTKEFQDTQHDNAKLRQKLQQAGIPITPVKRKTVQKDTEQALSSPDDEDPNEQEQSDILNDPTDVLSDKLPFNIEDTKAWVSNIRKDLSATQHKQFDTHVNKMLKIIEDKKFKQDELQTMATRFGLLLHMVTDAVDELQTVFQRENAVHAKVMLPTFKNNFAQFHSKQPIIYIGSTRLKPAQRDFNRLATTRQLQNGALPKVEVAIRYWVDNAKNGRFITLALSSHSGYRDAWAAEHATIQAWQARLSHPFIAKFLVKKDMCGANAYFDNKAKFMEWSIQAMDRWLVDFSKDLPYGYIMMKH
ncbi:unnamed protein product, partial [Symbiodinium pilosum]